MHTPLIFSYGLAQLFGLFLLIMAVVLISRRDYYRRVYENTKEDNPIIMLTATIGLIIGMLLIETHGVIELKQRLAVTIMCWMVFVNALLWLMMPEKMLAFTKKIIQGKGYFMVVGAIAVFGFWVLLRSSELFIFKEGLLDMAGI